MIRWLQSRLVFPTRPTQGVSEYAPKHCQKNLCLCQYVEKKHFNRKPKKWYEHFVWLSPFFLYATSLIRDCPSERPSIVASCIACIDKSVRTSPFPSLQFFLWWQQRNQNDTSRFVNISALHFSNTFCISNIIYCSSVLAEICWLFCIFVYL